MKKERVKKEKNKKTKKETNTKEKINKSLVTNLVALALITIGYFSPWGREQILNVGFFALSGAITNWLAIFMLFEKVPFIYGSGVVPVHFEEFKKGIKNLISEQFLENEKFQNFTDSTAQYFSNSINSEKLNNLIDYDSIFDSIKDSILKSKIGSMLSMFGGEAVVENFREPSIAKMSVAVTNILEDPKTPEKILEATLTPETTEEIKNKLIDMVDDRLNELTPQMVKEIVQAMIKKHLSWLVVWGGVFGGIIGLVMSFIPTI